jgi:putative ABC transport system permease protein
MGLRNVLRQKRRSIATISQITLAVALGLALFATGQSVTSDLNQVYGRFHYQVEVDANPGAPVLSQRALAIARTTPGVSSVEQVIETGVQYQEQEYPAYGLGSTTLYRYQLSAGRWFPRDDAGIRVPDVVLGPAVARAIHASIGEAFTLQTAGGPIKAKVIGIDTGQWDNGSVMYFDLSTLQQLTGMEGASNALWLTTASSGHSFINRVANDVEVRLGADGFPVQDQKLYVEAAQNQASNNQIITVIEILGLLVAGITLIGLVGALTMGVLERRREIGILRSLGATSRQVRRVFSVEGLVMAVIGWALGSIISWPLLLGLLAFVDHDFGVNVTAAYRLINVPEALALLIMITLLAIRAPLHRATHVKPSVVLRYQ